MLKTFNNSLHDAVKNGSYKQALFLYIISISFQIFIFESRRTFVSVNMLILCQFDIYM